MHASAADASPFWLRTAGPEGGEIRQLVSVNGQALFALASELRRSTDDGGTWQAVAVPFLVGSIAAGPQGMLWAAGADALAYSTDLGESWTLVTSPGPVRRLRFATGKIYVLRYDRLLVSSDNGALWTTLLQDNSLRDFAAGTNGVLYVSTYNALLQSTDEGATWGPVPSVQVIIDGAVLEPDPAGGLWIGVPAYDDYGGPWGGLYHWDGTQVVGPQVFDSASSIRTLADGSVLMACSGVGQMFSSYGGGVFRRAPGASTWQSLGAGGYAVTGAEQLANGALFASTTGLFVDYGAAPTAGVLRASQPGAQWTPVNHGLDFGRVSALAAQGSRVYAAADGKLQWTEDRGRTWKGHSASVGLAPSVLRIAPDGTLYMAGNGIFVRSTDGGVSWENKGPPTFRAVNTAAVLPNGWLLASGVDQMWASASEGDFWSPVTGFPTDEWIRGIEAGPVSRLFALTESAVYVSSDSAASWQRLGSFAPPLGDAQHLAIAGDEQAIYAFDTRGGHAWIDNGATWDEHPLPELLDFPHSVLVGPDQALYAAGSRAWRLQPGAAQWEELGAPATDTYWNTLPDLVLDERGFLYVSTWQNGVFRSALPLRESPSDAPAPGPVPGAPAPNPLRNRTAFTLDAPGGTPASLSVFDVRGRHVDTVRLVVPGAAARLNWTAPAALPGGVYYWELRTGSRVQHGRMTLVR